MPDFEIDAALAPAVQAEFGDTCSRCHGPRVISAGMAPDLRASALVASSQAFDEIVRGGSLAENGMPRYAHLSDEQLLVLRHYIRREARTALDK
jgi:quinohemoprotein ethanol dehydrogenase